MNLHTIYYDLQIYYHLQKGQDIQQFCFWLMHGYAFYCQG